MRRDSRTGLYYPFYLICAYVWEADERKENGGEYFLTGMYSVQDEDEAIKVFRSTKVTKDIPEFKLYMETEEESILLDIHDECGVWSVEGIKL